MPGTRLSVLAVLGLIGATTAAHGLASYQPGQPPTPTMTAEAWVCRQFLGVGGPGPPSTEAAEFLLRNESDRGPTNVYYWYYATLALYQHGGDVMSLNRELTHNAEDLERLNAEWTEATSHLEKISPASA